MILRKKKRLKILSNLYTPTYVEDNNSKIWSPWNIQLSSKTFPDVINRVSKIFRIKLVDNSSCIFINSN